MFFKVNISLFLVAFTAGVKAGNVRLHRASVHPHATRAQSQQDSEPATRSKSSSNTKTVIRQPRSSGHVGPAVETVSNPAAAFPVLCTSHEVCVDSSISADGCKICRQHRNDDSYACMSEPEHRMGSDFIPQQFDPDNCPTCRCLPLHPTHGSWQHRRTDIREQLLNPTSSTNSTGMQRSNVSAGSSWDSTLRTKRPLIVLGLTKSIFEIEPAMYVLLHRLSCANGGSVISGLEADWDVHLHLLVSRAARLRMADGKFHMNTEWVHKGAHGLKLCNLTMHKEDKLSRPLNLSGKSRIERIALLRDGLRDELDASFRIRGVNLATSQSAVIVIDLDLIQPPTMVAIRRAVSRVGPRGPFDLICAHGKDVNPLRLWAYDSFATILLPNTFVYPLKARKEPKLFPGEDERFVIQTPVKNEDVFKLFTREDLTMMIDKGPEVFPVRSCFGGLAV